MRALIVLHVSPAAWWLLAMLSVAGCSHFSPGQSARSPVAASGPTCVVRLKPAVSSPRDVILPLEPGMTVQTALEKSGAVRKFRVMEVHVLRPSPYEPLGAHRMAAEFDAVTRHVAMHADYALHPGDMIMVEQDASTTLERALKGALGSLASGL